MYCKSCKIERDADLFDGKKTCSICRERSGKNYTKKNRKKKEDEILAMSDSDLSEILEQAGKKVIFLKKFDDENFDESDLEKLMKNDERKLSKSTIQSYLKGFKKIVQLTEKTIIENMRDPETLITTLTEKCKSAKKAKDLLKSVNYMLNNVEGLSDYLGDEKTKCIKSFFKAECENDFKNHIDKTNETIEHTFQELLDGVVERYGPLHQHSILYYLYDNVHCRDDYGELIYITNKNVNRKSNYIYHNKKSYRLEIILNVYKTNKVYGQLKFPIDKHGYSILEYIKYRQLKHKDKFFNIDVNGRMGPVINRVNREVFSSLPKNSAINLIRHMVATERRSEPDIFTKLQHSKIISLTYRREYKESETDEEKK